MAAREDVQKALTAQGFEVKPWESYGSKPFTIVRPAGFAEGREIVEVWAVNAPNRSDPDEGLADYAAGLYKALRKLLLDVTASQGPEYNPSASVNQKGTPHATVVFTGAAAAVESLT